MQSQIIFKREKLVNVLCIKCNCFMWVGYCDETLEGYVCHDCLNDGENEE